MNVTRPIVTRFSGLACCALLGGCSLFDSPFEGTWLFMIEADSVSLAGTCTTVPQTYAEDGIEYQWVDIHSAGKDSLTVLMGEILTGMADGKSFTASNELTVQDANTYYQEGIEVSGDLEKGILSGEIIAWEQDISTTQPEYSCEGTWDYTAERSISHPEWDQED